MSGVLGDSMAHRDDSGVGCFWLFVGAVMLYNCAGDDENQTEEEYADSLSDYGYSDTVDYGTSDYGSYDYGHSDYDDSTEFDEDAAREEAERDLALEGYDYRYGCTIDCSGHEAGWQWRAENGYPVYDPDTYGNSYSFSEGAQAYEEAVEERVEALRDEHEMEYGY